MQYAYIHEKYLNRLRYLISDLKQPLLLWDELRNRGNIDKLKFAEEWFVKVFDDIYKEFELEDVFKDKEKSAFFDIINRRPAYWEKVKVNKEIWGNIVVKISDIKMNCEPEFKYKPIMDRVNELVGIITQI